MKSRVDSAVKNYENGYNCSQAVLCTYCDIFGIDEKTAFKIAEGFGGGMGGMQNTCGAVTAMFMLSSLKNSDGLLDKGNTKKDTYNNIKFLSEKFKESSSSTICKEILSNKDIPKKRNCMNQVQTASKIIEKYIIDNEIN